MKEDVASYFKEIIKSIENAWKKLQQTVWEYFMLSVYSSLIVVELTGQKTGLPPKKVAVNQV